MISDLAQPNSAPPGLRCKTPHALGNRHITAKSLNTKFQVSFAPSIQFEEMKCYSELQQGRE